MPKRKKISKKKVKYCTCPECQESRSLKHSQRSKEILKEFTKLQFIMKIFDYFNAGKRSKMQLINSRFYEGILPKWLHTVELKLYYIPDLSTIRFSGCQQIEKPSRKKQNKEPSRLFSYEFPTKEMRRRWEADPSSMKNLVLQGFKPQYDHHNMTIWNFSLSNGYE